MKKKKQSWAEQKLREMSRRCGTMPLASAMGVVQGAAGSDEVVEKAIRDYVAEWASKPTTQDIIGLVPDLAGDLNAVEHQRLMRGTSDQI